jgi:acetolactate synthase-1/2/3 large subunit
VCYEVTDASEVESTIVKAIAGKRTTIVNCIIHEDAMVYPMVAPGAAIDDLIMGDEEE